MEPRKYRKRLAVDVPTAVHDELKRMAIKYNCTLTKYLLRIIIERLKSEQAYDQDGE